MELIAIAWLANTGLMQGIMEIQYHMEVITTKTGKVMPPLVNTITRTKVRRGAQ
jgi:hypothetical protein